MDDQIDRGFSQPLLSLRGAAAASVLIFHAMIVFHVDGRDMQFHGLPWDQTWAGTINKLIDFLTNGHAAVTFFFVHSGFVLALSISRSGWGKGLLPSAAYFPAYIVKRIFRLWPMIIFSCVTAFLIQNYANLYHNQDFHSGWFRDFYAIPTNGDNLLANIALSKTNLVPTLWSLNIEVYGSLAILPMVLFCRTLFGCVLLLVAFFGLYQMLPPDPAFAPLFYAVSTITLTFMFCFAIGVMTASMRNDLPGPPRWLNRNACSLAALAALISWRHLVPHQMQIAAVVESAASAVIVYDVYYRLEGTIQDFCNLRFVQLLGEISYSLYVNAHYCLFFASVLIAAIFPAKAIAAHGLVFNLLGAALALSIAFGLSLLTYRFVERPFMLFGRNLADKIEAAILALGRFSLWPPRSETRAQEG